MVITNITKSRSSFWKDCLLNDGLATSAGHSHIISLKDLECKNLQYVYIKTYIKVLQGQIPKILCSVIVLQGNFGPQKYLGTIIKTHRVIDKIKQSIIPCSIQVS